MKYLMEINMNRNSRYIYRYIKFTIIIILYTVYSYISKN